MMSQLTDYHVKSLFVIEMKIYYFFLNSVADGEECCFDSWTNWQQSSLSCGDVCEHRKRKILDSDESLWDAGVSWLSDKLGAADNCNEDHSVCPDYESQSKSCDYIECRELEYRVSVTDLNLKYLHNSLGLIRISSHSSGVKLYADIRF